MSDLPSWAKVGAKVQCIHAGRWGKGADLSMWKYLRILFLGPPHAGGVYTITVVGYGSVTSVPVICLKGFGREGYPLDAFRPLVNSETDDEVEAKLYHKKGLHQSAPRRKAVDA